ncbi:unnamed protein product [Ceutorhynchus assimilis]|uniref:C2 domain-containing protein n=1 Tax=Ceutorhynchus assimilis TaxID=467358 RepID=A0A9P0DJZ6_9CUCU|nr:unnamed protein product [Ceutorhynchus assimilis]
MEIQAASGEWMNEFVRRPSRRRDAKVYVPAADIIKKTIRRSWTISNPTPRWAALRSSAELRPYNSLPRGQDINNYPSLALHQTNLKNTEAFNQSPRRAKSEDVYAEPLVEESISKNNSEIIKPARVHPLMSVSLRDRKRSPRRKTTEVEEISKTTEKVDDDSDSAKASTSTLENSLEKPPERHVSFDGPNKASDLAYFRSRSLSQSKSSKEVKKMPFVTHSLPEEGYGKEEPTGETNLDNTPVELCDIEPLSGTVFRKMTVRRRRQQNMRKMAAMDAGWRRPPENDLFDILLPDGEDYRLVFVNSDSSSKEDDIDDNDSSSASSFPLDECDWDYFEPGTQQVLGWSSPYGSPRVYRKRLIDSPLGSPLLQRRPRIRESSDEDLSVPSASESLITNPLPLRTDDAMQCVSTTGQSTTLLHPSTTSCCKTCGGCASSPAAQYIPVPVPIPIPFPVPWGTNLPPGNLVSLHNNSANADFWKYFAQVQGFPWSFFEKPMLDEKLASDNKNNVDAEEIGGKSTDETEREEEVRDEPVGHLDCENRGSSASDSTSIDSSDEDEDRPIVRKVYNVTGSPNDRESDDALPSSNVSTDNEDEIDRKSSADEKEREEEEETSSGSADTDSNDTGTVADQKPKRFSRVFVVNHKGSSSGSVSSSSGDSDSSDNDTDTELVVLTNVKQLNAEIDIEEDQVTQENEGGASFLSMKYIGEDVYDATSRQNNKSKARRKIRRKSEPGGSKSKNVEETGCDKVFEEENPLQVPWINTKDKLEPTDENIYKFIEAEIEFSSLLLINHSSSKVERLDCDNDTEVSEAVMDFTNDVEDDLIVEKSVNLSTILDETDKYKLDYVYSSSPGLSDVSAESLSSSDVEKENETKNETHSNVKVERQREKHHEQDEDNRISETTSASETDIVQSACRNHTGVSPSVIEEQPHSNQRNGAGAKYTSLVMITSDASYQQVNIVTSDTTKVVPGEDLPQVVVVSHTNRQNEALMDKGRDDDNPNHLNTDNNVTVITSAETLSAFEEGLADDDSWVENLSYDDEEEDDDFPTNSISENSSSGDEVTLTCSAVADQEDELRGYHRAAIDFTLHTIVEESCEESEVEQAPRKLKKPRPASATELEKYFFFGLGDGTIPSINSNREDAYSETSSIYSEGMESLGGTEDTQNENSEELASSRLEKYFLSGFMGFTAERRDSDGSVGSDSEGKPSPEQRRKRLVRARGTGRSHSNSLDNLLGNPDLAGSEQQLEPQNNSEDSSSSDSDTYDDVLSFEKSDGQFDTVKRKKAKKQKASLEDIKNLETTQEEQDYDEDDDRNKTPQPSDVLMPSNLSTNKNQQSRDSGFVGSCDDLLKDQRDINKSPDIGLQEKSETILEEKRTITESLPPATNLTRKDSFNNWSSDEETNLMMSKMRQFFKTMVANTPSSKPTTPNLSNRSSPKPFPRAKTRCKPPQLVYFENELTRLMKTVPGIRDDQVREIVEYLSSEDTWSDSYDSSDYTSSDLEGACTKSELQQQISDSCKQIINKFDINAEDEEGDAGDGGIVIDDVHGLNKETAFVYQKLVASFEKMATEDKPDASTSNPNSPPLIAKVMHHIGSRLVALMHEMSSGESHASNSPKGRNYHKRLQQKLSNASSTTTDDDSTSDTNLQDTFVEESYNLLPRSRSHDLLMSETNKNLHQSISGVSEISEEPSDCERFSWRGSFESALLATDSRNKLSLIGGEGSASASALAIAAKRRSAGDLLFSHKSLSREQLDRVRSCGSIGGSTPEDKLWVATATKPNRRRSSVPDAASCDDEDEEMENRATLPRSLQSGPQTTNSLPRLPTTSVAALQKAQSHHFLSQNVKSARYRPPGITRLMPTQPKRAVSAPGLQPSHQRRGGRRSQQSNVPNDDVSLSEAHSSPMLASRSGSKSATPSPVAPGSRRKAASVSSQEWPTNEDDIDRLVSMHHNRSSLSSLGLRSDSMASVYSGAGEGRYGSVTVRGQIEFGLQYNYKAGSLEIQIKQCKDLAPVDVKRNRSDPYVKVYLLPDKSKSGKRKTKVKKHTLNPVFDECLKFHMSINELELRTLWLSVWHSDMFGRNDFLGEVMMTLENKVFDEPTPKWYNLQERTEPFEDVLSFKGDIIVCLKFVPPDMTVHKKGKRSRGSLHILVKEAKSLTAVKANGSSDPFCKSYLLPDKGRSVKQKTPVVKRTINPVWNFTFVYDDVTLQELAERSLELTVWDHDRLASNEFLGMVRFSLGTGKHFGKPVEWMDSTGKELNLWKSMLERPNFWVEGCLPLRPTVGTRLS